MSDNVSQDFVFGTLATDDLRLAQLRAAVAGVLHAHDLEPLDPRPGEACPVRVRRGVRSCTPTGSPASTRPTAAIPSGERGRATVGRAVDLERTGVEWDTLAWAYGETWAGHDPAAAGRHGGALPDRGLVRPTHHELVGDGDRRRRRRRPAARRVRMDARLLESAGPRCGRCGAAGATRTTWTRIACPTGCATRSSTRCSSTASRPTDGRPFAAPATPGGFYGGTLRGVTERLDYIGELGATCLWLSPLFPSPSHHGYDATDYRLASSLVSAPTATCASWSRRPTGTAIRVVLDFVANHVSWEHPAFLEARADRDSPEAGWFTFTRLAGPVPVVLRSPGSPAGRLRRSGRARLPGRQRPAVARARRGRVPLRLRQRPVACILERVPRRDPRGEARQHHPGRGGGDAGAPAHVPGPPGRLSRLPAAPGPAAVLRVREHRAARSSTPSCAATSSSSPATS